MNGNVHVFILVVEFTDEVIQNLQTYHNILCMQVFDTFLDPEDAEYVMTTQGVCDFLKLIIVKQIKYFKTEDTITMAVQLDRDSWEPDI